MPVYEYQCDSCGLLDEKLWSRVSIAKDTIPCGECGTPMRKLLSLSNHQFKHGAKQTRGALPPSTGTSDDWNFDKAIGADAEKKWETIEKRDAIKDTHIRDERKAGRVVTKEQLVPTVDGSYRTITEGERVRANQNRDTAFKIAQAAKKKGGTPQSSGSGNSSE